MKKILFAFMAMVLTFICRAQENNREEQLDHIFAMLHKQNQFNGAVLIAEKGKVIFEKGYGYSNEDNRRRNNEQTIFELASCSKQFTAAAIVLLKRQGKLRYEDKVSRYLPELGFWDQVTISDLLRHTSGLPNDYISQLGRDWDRTRIAGNNDVIRYYEGRKDSLRFAPGSRHEYNNNNYVLLASIIERVSGMSYGDFLARNIFRPLDMKRTFVYNRREHPRNIPNYATGYIWNKNTLSKTTSEASRFHDSTAYFLDGIVGAAKVNSSVEDIYKWMVALKQNKLFTQAEFDEMTAVSQTAGGENVPYGFGLNLSKGDGKFSFGHTGNWDGYVSFISQNMIKDRTIIILQNLHTGLFPFNNINQVLDSKPLEPRYREKIALPEENIKKYTGVYTDGQNESEAHLITYHDGHLFYNASNGEYDMRFFPVAANEFQALRSNGDDGLMRFTVIAGGALQLEMLQDGERVGSGIRKKDNDGKL